MEVGVEAHKPDLVTIHRQHAPRAGGAAGYRPRLPHAQRLQGIPPSRGLPRDHRRRAGGGNATRSARVVDNPAGSTRIHPKR
ncbi:UvrD/REP helicase [Carbonactinospora thermoautotrophica]|uniref:UvrD/REP helicase n=1 Tax=Carbonactinospora thermoautotrophica TaxID=1469144 RepID=A0A132MPL8_9ACTN|nr:UvrD/REP helicase [Carbonactinospora thermoautotrophica]